MVALSPVGFAAIVWGTIALVVVVFVYELFAIAMDFGWTEVGPKSGD